MRSEKIRGPRRLATVTLATALLSGGVAAADTLRVNNLSDASGSHLCIPGASACTLRAALDMAERTPSRSFQIILDKQGTYLLSKSFTITKAQVMIKSATGLPAKAIIDGQAKGTVFLVKAASGFTPVLALRGVTVQNGRATNATGDQGGGFVISGANVMLNLADVVVRNNRALGFGAGIAMGSGTFLSMQNTLVQGNRGTSTDCGGGFFTAAGGLFLASGSQASIDSSTFDGNQQCRAGAILVGDAALDVHNTTFRNNVGESRGGAILFVGGSGSKTVQMRFNTIVGNQAGTGGSSAADRSFGGGLAFEGFKNRLTLSGNLIADNKVVNADPEIVKVTKTPGHDCGIQGAAFSVDTFGNFFSTIGASTGTVPNAGTVGTGDSARRFSDCVALRAKSVAGIDGTKEQPRRLNAQLTFVQPSNTTKFQTPFFTSTAVTVVDGFRPNSTTSSNHFCFFDDQRGFLRPNPSICDIGSIEGNGTP